MEKSTIGTIYALKSGDRPFDEVVAEYWSKYTGTPIDGYNERVLMRIVQNVFLDYISTADNPRYEVWNLFENMWFDCNRLCKCTDGFDKRIRNAIYTTLIMTDVRDGEGFVNGFREADE
jgi:hypothetical protein